MFLEDQEGRRSPGEYAGNGRKRNGNGKRGNGKAAAAAKKDVEEDSVHASAGKEGSEAQTGSSSTASVWSELTKQKKLSTAQESQESRRTIAKRELKLLLSDARAHELTDVGRTSLRDKVNREYLSEMSKDNTFGNTATDQAVAGKRRGTRRSFSQSGGDTLSSQASETAGTTDIATRVISAPNSDEVNTNSP